MENMQVVEIVVSVITALGGWEMIKYCMNRKTNRRKEEAEADNVEFNVLREAMDFLQAQLKEKEQRFAEQTDLVRKQNLDILQLNKEKAQLELDLQRYKCVIKGCVKRDPQNVGLGFLLSAIGLSIHYIFNHFPTAQSGNNRYYYFNYLHGARCC